jgi:predicted porin
MKKHLIAAAVAGALAVPAMAQVTVSGTLDVQALNNSKTTSTAAGATTTTSTKATGNDNDASTANGTQDGWATSQLVFSAKEDLGGGLTASAVFSNRMSQGSLGVARDRYIDLAGGFGSIRIGRFNSALTAGYLGLTGQPTTANAGSTYGFAVNGSLGTGASTDTGSMERQYNMFQYTTPNIGGLVATVGMHGNSSDASHTAAGALSAGKTKASQSQATVTYSAGPLMLGAAYGKREVTTDGTAGRNEGKLTYFGGSYDMGMAKVNATYGTRKHTDTTSGASVTDQDTKLTTVGVAVPMGAITLNAYVYSGDDDRSAGAATGVKLKGHQLGARYAFSKRTFAYLVTGQDKTTRSGTSTEAIAKTNQSGLGIVHNF